MNEAEKLKRYINTVLYPMIDDMGAVIVKLSDALVNDSFERTKQAMAESTRVMDQCVEKLDSLKQTMEERNPNVKV